MEIYLVEYLGDIDVYGPKQLLSFVNENLANRNIKKKIETTWDAVKFLMQDGYDVKIKWVD